MKWLIHNAHFAAPSAAVEEISYYEDKKLGKAQLPDCPFNPSDSPCKLETDLMVLREAERESMEIFYAMCIHRNESATCMENFRQVAGGNPPPNRKGPPVIGSASQRDRQSQGSVIVVGNRDATLLRSISRWLHPLLRSMRTFQ